MVKIDKNYKHIMNAFNADLADSGLIQAGRADYVRQQRHVQINKVINGIRRMRALRRLKDR